MVESEAFASRLPVRLYASFAADEFGGNIAGVVHDDVGLSERQMRGIAAELGAPTTGFVRQRDATAFAVRFLSTRSEMGMCGHVTVAIFVSLFEDGRIASTIEPYRLATPAGTMTVRIALRDGRPLVTMYQLSPRFDLVGATAGEIAPLLGIGEVEIVSLGAASTALSHLFVELPDQAALAAIHPRDDELRSLSRSRSIDTIGVWCRKPAGERSAAVRLRDLCHGVGDAEEAASGTPLLPACCGSAGRSGRTSRESSRSRPSKSSRWADRAEFRRASRCRMPASRRSASAAARDGDCRGRSRCSAAGPSNPDGAAITVA